MTPQLRKFTLLAHITFSVGWFGAVVPYIALAIAGLTSYDFQMVRAAYLSMEFIGWFVIVPFSVVALLSGLVQSLGTQWGLFRHWWIVVKVFLTIVATLVLLRHMAAVSHVARVVAQATPLGADFRALQIQLLIHPSGGLLVLLAAMTLSVFKLWGMTPYGRRVTRPTDLPSYASKEVRLVREPALATGWPRWRFVVGVHAVVLILLFVVIMHLTGAGPRMH